ncbi:MAG TPA: uracil-DNA glycosylase [Fimbriimonas sp.]|nr:uracil-DNA glycosylase [Fimbriimonas sp.]
MQALDDLRLSALNCQKCEIAQRRTTVVFGEGDPRSPLVLVGEGPGDQEDKTGRPFVGRAGQLLDQALTDAGISRARVYICNTVKCRAADWSTGKPQNRPPTEEETLNCRSWLLPQLAIIAPKVILCIGAPSAKNLIRKNFAITKERGQYFPCELAKTAIATLHPSYILRQQNINRDDGGYGLLVQDIKKAWDAAVKLREKDA